MTLGVRELLDLAGLAAVFLGLLLTQLRYEARSEQRGLERSTAAEAKLAERLAVLEARLGERVAKLEGKSIEACKDIDYLRSRCDKRHNGGRSC